ncbi:phage baseplate protein [Flexibacterium corallicola]|uniref:phage baseplate protein n=1 Tax=Flexibacterium corallicola TaxID=3037259 RepID=UPI00286F6573|nr:phage baseplate protein [Pseudovibrio sp. M1P-2-3]
MELQHLHWQHKIKLGPEADWDRVAIGLEDLAQSLRIIVLTPKLSVPTEPEKFCDALSYIDRPPAEAVPGISKEIWDAITKWEERVVLERVDAEASGFAHFRATISWYPVEAVEAELQRTVVDLQRAT